ncbi:AMP-binding protein [Rhizobium sp. SSA_523]|uniref:AMP-binding protein n=1 Tax=Rhizobium sp. SSA_523 TaxID=2952477 RepID=UPI0020903918|nr:AMP-binding protein [Rhizobium sp. SSA_523]MCO5733193.1 AMP-binding protein [Rhizobium sp. SSA_523]WKC22559.1 AMP-binding protein [Rhizobium sp. SSA_523]
MADFAAGNSFSLVAEDPVGYRARVSPAAIAIRTIPGGDVLTYAELDDRIARCAFYLNTQFGARGPLFRVAALARNCADLIVVAFACQRARAIFVPLNWRLSTAELTAIVKDCGPEIIIHAAEFEAVAGEIAETIPSVRTLPFDGASESLDGVLAQAEPLRRLRSDPDEPALLLYTSGTTGAPKGVILTRRNLFYSAVNFSFVGEITPGCVTFCDLPFFHTIGLVAIARTTLMMGGTLLISDRFLPDRTLSCLNDAELGVTHYFAVPQMASILRGQPDYAPEKMRRLKAIFIGGAPLPPPLVASYLADGVALVNGYGMSEAGTVMHMPLDPQAIATRHGSVGFPAPLIELKICDEAGRERESGEIGEIWLRGPSISPGYWNKPAETAAAFVDGWFRTGDMAMRDEDGFHCLADRLKDMYISGGENVYPAEVEGVLAAHPAIAEVAVIGVADARWGETGAAFVVLNPGQGVERGDLAALCTDKLAAFKRPAHYVFTDAIPRNAAGKPQKHILRAQWQSGAADPAHKGA